MSARAVRLGLRENLAQFGLLVAINAFVGAMVGLERSALPLIGRDDRCLLLGSGRQLAQQRFDESVLVAGL